MLIWRIRRQFDAHTKSVLIFVGLRIRIYIKWHSVWSCRVHFFAFYFVVCHWHCIRRQTVAVCRNKRTKPRKIHHTALQMAKSSSAAHWSCAEYTPSPRELSSSTDDLIQYTRVSSHYTHATQHRRRPQCVDTASYTFEHANKHNNNKIISRRYVSSVPGGLFPLHYSHSKCSNWFDWNLILIRFCAHEKRKAKRYILFHYVLCDGLVFGLWPITASCKNCIFALVECIERRR